MRDPVKPSRDLQNTSAEVAIRAERQGGALLSQIEREPPGPRRKDTGNDAAISTTYQDACEAARIEERDARRWQLEATLPEPQFEVMVATAKARRVFLKGSLARSYL